MKPEFGKSNSNAAAVDSLVTATSPLGDMPVLTLVMPFGAEKDKVKVSAAVTFRLKVIEPVVPGSPETLVILIEAEALLLIEIFGGLLRVKLHAVLIVIAMVFVLCVAGVNCTAAEVTRGGALLVTATGPSAMLRLLATLVIPFVAAKVRLIVSPSPTLRLKVSVPFVPVPSIPLIESASLPSVDTVIPVVVPKVQSSLVTIAIILGLNVLIVAELTVGGVALPLAACSTTPALDNHTVNHLQTAVKVHLPKTTKTPEPKLSVTSIYP